MRQLECADTCWVARSVDLGGRLEQIGDRSRLSGRADQADASRNAEAVRMEPCMALDMGLIAGCWSRQNRNGLSCLPCPY